MLRPLGLLDLTHIHRLGDKATSWRAEHALTSAHPPLREALAGLVVSQRFQTFVWKAEDGEASAFVQLYLEEGHPHAQIVFVGPASGNGADQMADDSVYLSLFDQLAVEAGRRGIHSLVAEADESGRELTLLRRAGFAIYTRQEVWVLRQAPDQPKVDLLRPCKTMDDWEIQLLYANTVPRLIQLVEPTPPTHYGAGWVMYEGDELAGFVHVFDGPAASWLRFYIHPRAEVCADDMVAAAVQIKPPTADHPVYCCLRRYQSWLQSSLARAGFQLVCSQAVMARHTVQHVQKPIHDLATVLDAPGVKRATGSTS